MSKPQPYKVRDIHVVAKGNDVLVREYTLDPGEAIPWHHHTEVADYYYGLEGVVLVETREPAARHEVPGFFNRRPLALKQCGAHQYQKPPGHHALRRNLSERVTPAPSVT